MKPRSLESLAHAEIDEYREQLVPAGLVERQMQRLALELVGMVGEGESHGILLRAAAYLKRVAGWTDVDPRLRPETRQVKAMAATAADTLCGTDGTDPLMTRLPGTGVSAHAVMVSPAG